MTPEDWRPVVGLEDLYEVSDQGRVRSVARAIPFMSKAGSWHLRNKQSKVLTPQKINSGYLVVHMSRDEERIARTVHSIVAAAFIGPRPKRHDVAHNNGDKTDNRAANLRYATRRENHADKRKHGTNACGSKIVQARFTESQIPSVRALQGRLTAAEVARRYGVADMTIWRIWNRESWTHV